MIVTTFSASLACGHSLTCTVKTDGDCTTEGSRALVVHQAAQVEYWLKTRGALHQCALVTEANPNGIPPK